MEWEEVALGLLDHTIADIALMLALSYSCCLKQVAHHPLLSEDGILSFLHQKKPQHVA